MSTGRAVAINLMQGAGADCGEVTESYGLQVHPYGTNGGGIPYRMIGMENRFWERDEADVGVREQLQARHKTVKGDVPRTTRIIRS